MQVRLGSLAARYPEWWNQNIRQYLATALPPDISNRIQKSQDRLLLLRRKLKVTIPRRSGFAVVEPNRRIDRAGATIM